MRNVELLEKTMQFIKDNPERHNQGSWCGTAQCFAGWVAQFAGYRMGLVDGGLMNIDVDGGIVVTGDVATASLGLTSSEADVLFWSANSVPMLELMVKDLVNGDELQDRLFYLRTSR